MKYMNESSTSCLENRIAAYARFNTAYENTRNPGYRRDCAREMIELRKVLEMGHTAIMNLARKIR